MANIKLNGGFTLIPEGTHVFKITDVEYKESYGKIAIKMETATGLKHTENFTLLKSNGETNEPALNAFSFFAKTALNDYALEEIDHTALIGHYIRCEVQHSDPQPNRNNPEKMVQFVRLGDKSPADGFDVPVNKQSKTTTPPQTAPAAHAPSGTFDIGDIDALLNS